LRAEQRPAATLPMWQGRRGTLNAIVCGVLGLLCALGVLLITERAIVVPACTAYASAHDMTYSDFKLVGRTHADTVVCLLLRADGKTQDVYLKTLVSYLTDLLVSLAMNLEITVPGFIILLALARSAPYLLTQPHASP
jgi:hypothetical protein